MLRRPAIIIKQTLYDCPAQVKASGISRAAPDYKNPIADKTTLGLCGPPVKKAGGSRTGGGILNN